MFSSPSMYIRRAVEREAASLSALALKGKRHWGYPDAQIEAWRLSLDVSPEEIRSQPTFIGDLDGRIIGFYSLAPDPSGVWELAHLWVEPEHLMQGYGRALLGHALRMAADEGATELHVDADPHAESFYLACGAVPIGTVAAPIAGQPNRVRPQLAFACAGL